MPAIDDRCAELSCDPVLVHPIWLPTRRSSTEAPAVRRQRRLSTVDKLLTIFKVPELRRKILFTAMLLAIYRIGFYVPLPIVNQAQLKNWEEQQAATPPASSSAPWPCSAAPRSA